MSSGKNGWKVSSTEPLYPRGFLEHPFGPGSTAEHGASGSFARVAQGGMGIVYEARRREARSAHRSEVRQGRFPQAAAARSSQRQ